MQRFYCNFLLSQERKRGPFSLAIYKSLSTFQAKTEPTIRLKKKCNPDLVEGSPVLIKLTIQTEIKGCNFVPFKNIYARVCGLGSDTFLRTLYCNKRVELENRTHKLIVCR